MKCIDLSLKTLVHVCRITCFWMKSLSSPVAALFLELTVIIRIETFHSCCLKIKVKIQTPIEAYSECKGYLKNIFKNFNVGKM